MENKEVNISLLSNIANAIKRSLDTPVIYVTGKDYAENYMKSIYNIREALLESEDISRISEIVNNFHLEWFQAIQEIEEFRKRIKETSRQEVAKSIQYTIECVQKRCDYFKIIVGNLHCYMDENQKAKIDDDIGTIEDLQVNVTAVLNETTLSVLDQADQIEFTIKLRYETEELLNWLDRLYNNLAIHFSKLIDLPIPLVPSDLTKTLREIIEEVAASATPNATEIVEEIKKKGSRLSSLVHVNAYQDLKIKKVLEKIKILEARISNLKDQNSSAVLALRHKVIYLEDRLQSLENLKLSLHVLKTTQEELSDTNIRRNNEWPIFNHNLPLDERCRLVSELVTLWDNALTGRGHHRRSIITILSQTDMKEMFIDDLGNFTIDQYGRKIYTISNSSSLYQLNESNELVPVNDEKHVYYYDECGRYFIDEEKNRRIYKAHDNASEYELDYSGVLVKVREYIDGTEYRYDELGCFYVDKSARRIYCELGVKYNRDSFGNIFKNRDNNKLSIAECPAEPNVTKEFKYLQRTVGEALKKCLANVLLCQPSDPINHLANNLVKYKQNMDDRQKKCKEEKAMFAEREYLVSATSTSPSYVNKNYDNETTDASDYSKDVQFISKESTAEQFQDL